MPIYTVEAPNGKVYELEGPEGSTPEQLSSALYAQIPEASNPPKDTSAGFNLGDLARSAGSGVAGGLQALAGVAGANNQVSNYLGDVSKNLQEGLSPERKAEMQARQEKIAAAEKTGSIWEQIKAGAGAVAEAPLQSFATGAGSMVTPLAAGAAAIALAPEALVGYVGANVLSRIAIGTVGAAMGSGQSKQDIFDRVKKEYMDAKVPEAEAEKKAMLAQNWVGKNIDQIAINAGTGAFEAATGAGRVLAPGKAAVKAAVKAPSLLKTIPAVGLEEAVPEVLQSLSGTAATNVAASREGFEAPTFQGAAAPAAESGLTAFLLGSAAGPKEYLGKRGEYEVKQRALDQQRAADEVAAAPKPPDITDPAYLQQIQTQYQEAEQRKAALKSQLRKVEDGSVTETADRLHNKDLEEQIKAMNPELEQLATEYNKASKVAPAFTPEAAPGPVEIPEAFKTPEAPKPTTTVGDALDNPLGRFTTEELSSRSPKIVDYINEQRTKLGKPALNDYSIEDIRDAMPGELPDAEKADLNSLIAAKTSYTPDVTYKPEDIINVSKQKNIATDTDGFKFFLQRATGDNDLTKMEQPQLHSAFTALSGLPEFDETQFLPEKTSATHYSPQQYNSAVQKVSGLASEKDIPSSQALQVAKKATGLTRDSDVQLLLQNAYTSGDLNLSSKGDFITAQPAEQAEFKVEEGFAQAQPTGFNVMRGDQLLYSTQNEAEAKAKVESLGKTADPAMKQIDKSIAGERSTVSASQRSLDIMEAGGMFRTPKYQQASAQHAAMVQKANDNIQRLNEKKVYLQQPVTIQTTGKPLNVKTYKVKEKGVSEKAFNTREEALKHALENLPAARLNELAGKTKAPGFAKRLQAEIERRKNPPKPFLAAKPEPKVETKVEPKVEAKPEKTAEKEAVKSQILPMLKKFGLGDVALQIEEGMQAEGSYAASVIKVALDANNPVRVLRHESIHGLKDLGLFTPGQWKVLENQADKVWIDKYLKQRNINGQPIQGGQQSRFEAYQNLYNGDMDAIREEAIADAFGDFDVNGAPKGLFATLLQKMQDFFRALRSAFTGAGYETADDVFGKVERGELKATAKAGTEAKLSLAGEGVPLSTKGIMESNTKYAQANLGLNGKIVYKVFNPKTGEVISPHDARATAEKKAKKLGLEVRDEQVNNVRDIAKALNKQTIAEQGAMGEKDLSPENSKIIANAIADEVGYQLSVTAKTGTGLGWYSNNYPKAVKLLSSRFPELQDSKHARSVFSALVAVTSNGERVDKNIANAIELYADLRQGKPLVAMGNRRATALENNLKQIEDLLAKHKENFEQELTREITVKDLNAYLRSIGEKTSGDYLANTKVPAAAIYFGPKLGAFFANLSGSEGYLTMDLWWTRSINRMRGLLIPKATEASITKFRDMMDRPSATREEVIAASIPLRNKYEEYGYTTELEHLVGSKEPSTSANKPAWFKKAEKAGGDAYEQLKYEHNLEKMANTIYKNEYDMLEEAPFTASDRKFMYDAARQAQRILGERGVKLTLADIQAALWYYEKRLYAKLSGREADDIGYEEAIIGQSRKSDRRERPSVVFSGQPDGGNVAAGEVTVPNEDGGRANEEKLSLRTAPDTPAFKRFFGNSKVVDANGEPKLMYHGTARDIKEFKPRQAGAIFLTENPEFAAEYAETSSANKALERNLLEYSPQELAKAKKQAIADVKASYGFTKTAANIVKEINLPKQEGEALDFIKLAADKLFPVAGQNVMPVFVSAQNPFDYENPEHIKALGLKGINTEDLANNVARLESDRVQNAIRAAGFDSFYIKQGNQKNIGVYSSTQIKSATGNIGTYDPTNPDIRYSLRSAPDTPEFKKWLNNSKVVNKDGTAKPLFHSTYSDFTEPRTNYGTDEYRRWGFHVGPLDAAESRLGVKEAEDKYNRERSGNAAPNVVPFWVKAERPLRLDENRSGRWGVDDIMRAVMDKAQAGKIKGIDADMIDSYFNDQLDIDGITGNEPSVGDEGYDPNAEPRSWSNDSDFATGERSSLLKAFLQQQGYDSIVYKNDFEGGGDSYIVFSPNQVKSVLGNTGAYGKTGDTRYSLRTDVAEDIRNMPNGAAIEAAINRTTATRQEVGFVERMTAALAPESFSYLRQKALDRYNRLNDVEKLIATQMGGIKRLADQNAHAAALQSDAAAGVAASALGVGNRLGGIPVYRNGYTTVSNENGTVKGAVEIFSPLAKYGNPKIYQAYQFWAGAKRGNRLITIGKEELYTQQDMDLAKQLCYVDAKGNVSGKYPEFASVQKDWIKYNDGLVKYAVDTGVISAQNAAEFTRYSDYVPFYRQLDGERTVGPNIFQSISGVKPPKELTGSKEQLADFLETIVRNTQSIIQAGMKNVAAQKAINGGMIVGMVRKLDHVSSHPDTVTILEKGKKVSYECADKLWVDAVSSLNLPELPFLNFLAMPANFLRAAVTKDPGFMLANLMRDSVSAYVTSGAKLTPVASAVKEFGNVLMNNSPEYQKLLSAGVLGGYEFSRNVEASAEAFGKDLRKKTGTKTGFESATSPFTFFWDALEKGTEASDAATRIAVYKATLAETGNEAEAIHRALEVMNFNRKGSSAVVRIAAAAIPFLNARVQGLDVFFRSGIRPFLDANATEQEKQVQKAMIIRGMTILSLSVMYAAAISGNPDYEKQEEETKDNNWIIPMGEGKTPLKIPIPFEVGTLFKTVPERIYRSFFMPDKENRDTTEALHKSMKRALQSTFGFNPVPQIAAPLLEARDNYSVFTQRPIVGQNMQGIAPEFQVGPGTSKWAEILGQQAGMSPMMIDHVFKGYTGTMGVYAADLLDAAIGATVPSEVEKPSKRIDQMPIIKRFLADPEARGKITSYFDLKHQVDTTVRTINMLEKQADPNLPNYVEKNAQLFAARDFMNNLNKQMDDLQKQANMIRSAPIPADEKQEMLREITKAQNLLVNDIRQIRNILKP